MLLFGAGRGPAAAMGGSLMMIMMVAVVTMMTPEPTRAAALPAGFQQPPCWPIKGQEQAQCGRQRQERHSSSLSRRRRPPAVGEAGRGGGSGGGGGDWSSGVGPDSSVWTMRRWCHQPGQQQQSVDRGDSHCREEAMTTTPPRSSREQRPGEAAAAGRGRRREEREDDMRRRPTVSRQGLLQRGMGLAGAAVVASVMGGGSGASWADGIDVGELQQRQLQQQQLEQLAAARQAAATEQPQQQPELQPQFYNQQIDQAMPIKTLRGVWRIREFRDGEEEVCKGRLIFRGFVDDPLRGTLEYMGCNDRKGRGNWLLKPARIDKGQIRFSARWKVNFKGGDPPPLIYRGDVVAGGDSYAKAEASILEGEVLRPIKGVTGNLTERRCGAFEADLIERITDEDKL